MEYPFDFNAVNRGRIAHGILMSAAVLIFFPLGAIVVRVISSPHTVLLHRIWQLIGLCMLLAGAGLGLWIQDQIGIRWSAYHQTLGIAITAAFVLMPVIGGINHAYYLKHGKSTALAFLHVWGGRALIIIGMIDGGFGLALAYEGMPATTAYAVIAGVFGAMYLMVIAWWYTRRSRRNSVKEISGPR